MKNGFMIPNLLGCEVKGMKKEQLMKARKSVELCNLPADEDVCEQCPYFGGEGDKVYGCIDKRYKDLIEILDWGIKTVETLEDFLRKR